MSKKEDIKTQAKELDTEDLDQVQGGFTATDDLAKVKGKNPIDKDKDGFLLEISHLKQGDPTGGK